MLDVDNKMFSFIACIYIPACLFFYPSLGPGGTTTTNNNFYNMDPYEDVQAASVEPPAWTKHWRANSNNNNNIGQSTTSSSSSSSSSSLWQLQEQDGNRNQENDSEYVSEEHEQEEFDFGTFESSKFDPAELFYPSSSDGIAEEEGGGGGEADSNGKNKQQRKKKKTKKWKKKKKAPPSVVTMKQPLKSAFGVVGAGMGVSGFQGLKAHHADDGAGDSGWGVGPVMATER